MAGFRKRSVFFLPRPTASPTLVEHAPPRRRVQPRHAHALASSTLVPLYAQQHCDEHQSRRTTAERPPSCSPQSILRSSTSSVVARSVFTHDPSGWPCNPCLRRSPGAVRTRRFQHTGSFQPDRLALAGWAGSAGAAPFSGPAGASGGPPNLWPPAAGLHQRGRRTAHSDRPMDSDRQRSSRAWVRSMARGSQRNPACSSCDSSGLSLRSMAGSGPLLANQSCCG